LREEFDLPDWSPLDTFMVVLLVASAIWGAWRGLVYELLAIVNWLAAAALTGVLAPLVADWVPFLAGNGLLAMAVRYVAVFVVLIFLGGFVASLVRRVISKSGLRPADRSLGAIFGLVRGVLVLSVLTFLVFAFGFQAEAWWQSSVGAHWLSAALQTLKPLLPQGLERLIS
jgi:membrane protein required for colicin V production